VREIMDDKSGESAEEDGVTGAGIAKSAPQRLG